MSAARTKICGSGEKYYVIDNRSANDSYECAGTDSHRNSDSEVEELSCCEEGDCDRERGGGCATKKKKEWSGGHDIKNEDVEALGEAESLGGGKYKDATIEGVEDIGTGHGDVGIACIIDTEGDDVHHTSEQAPATISPQHDPPTQSSSRPRRNIKAPERLHKNAWLDYVDNDLFPVEAENDDEATRRKRLKEVSKKKGKREAAEEEEEFDSTEGNGGSKQQGEGKNGKKIQPVLPGSKCIAAPSYYVYLMQAATQHWYIGFSSQPWHRLREHNGHVRIKEGSNIGAFTSDPTKRPWRQVLLVGGFENEISAQSFEAKWQARHSKIEKDQSIKPDHFIKSLIALLYKREWSRNLLDVRFFDAVSRDSWDEQFQNYYRPAPLNVIDNIHVDVPGWDIDTSADVYKNHPLGILGREVEDYSQYREHFVRGRSTITQSNTELHCTVCRQVIEANAGAGNQIFAGSVCGTIAASPLMVLCPAAGCRAVSHLTCLADRHYKEGRNSVSRSVGQHPTLRVPISGKCLRCGESGDWVDYRREINWRLNADQEQWRTLWYRKRQKGKAGRRAKKRRSNSKRRTRKTAPRSSPRHEAFNHGPSHKQHRGPTTHDRDVIRAIQDCIYGQLVTGDFRRLTWYEKILLGDVICTERFLDWINFHIDNVNHVKFLPKKNDRQEEPVLMGDITRFFDASSIPWAHFENSRAAGAAGQAPKHKGRNAPIPRGKTSGKRIFQRNDTYWMDDDNVTQRRKRNDSLALFTSRRMMPWNWYSAEMAQLNENAAERRLRIAEEKVQRPRIQAQRKKENKDEQNRLAELASVKKKRIRLAMRGDNTKSPSAKKGEIKRLLKIERKLNAAGGARLKIMAGRQAMALKRSRIKWLDMNDAERRRKLRRGRRYMLAAQPTRQALDYPYRPQRRLPQDRVRFVDTIPVTLLAGTRSGLIRHNPSTLDDALVTTLVTPPPSSPLRTPPRTQTNRANLDTPLQLLSPPLSSPPAVEGLPEAPGDSWALEVSERLRVKDTMHHETREHSFDASISDILPDGLMDDDQGSSEDAREGPLLTPPSSQDDAVGVVGPDRCNKRKRAKSSVSPRTPSRQKVAAKFCPGFEIPPGWKLKPGVVMRPFSVPVGITGHWVIPNSRGVEAEIQREFQRNFLCRYYTPPRPKPVRRPGF